MASNSFRHRPSQPTRQVPRKAGLFENIISWFKSQLHIGDSLPTETLKRIVWLGLLCIGYIYIQHSYEGFIKKIEKTRTEMEEKRAEYISQKSRYMLASKQSEIAKKLTDKGLEENKMPPNKIVVKE